MQSYVRIYRQVFITAICKFLSVHRSSFYYCLKDKDCEDKDSPLRINHKRPASKSLHLRMQADNDMAESEIRHYNQ